jgi:hypothetical protein
MVGRIASLSSMGSLAAALVALSVVMFAGSADAHVVASAFEVSTETVGVAGFTGDCPAAETECDYDAEHTSAPCAGMSDGHCSMSGVMPPPMALLAPFVLTDANSPLTDRQEPGISTSVDTPPPRT